MIGYLEGKIIQIEEKEIVLLAGSVGYRVMLTEHALVDKNVGDQLGIFTYLAVRDDALDLYGFLDKQEERVFRALLRVSGIGPKTAMNILSSTGAELLSRAISSNDPSYMTKISGVGKKTAEKIVLELKDHASFAQGGEQATTAEGEALDALETLGYQIRDTRDIVRMIANKEHDASSIVREALKQLGKK